MTLPFFCQTCNHLRSDHEEGSAKCLFHAGQADACTCQRFVSPFLGQSHLYGLQKACEKVAAECLAPFCADQEALAHATTLIRNLVVSQLTEPVP